MRQWAENELPQKSVEVGWEALQEEFRQFLDKAKNSKDHDDLFDNLKQAVVDEALARHTWEDKVRVRKRKSSREDDLIRGPGVGGVLL